MCIRDRYMSEYFTLTKGAKLPPTKTLGMKAKFGALLSINDLGSAKIAWSG